MFVKAIITQQLKELRAQYSLLSANTGFLCKALRYGEKAIQWCFTLERGRKTDRGRGTERKDKDISLQNMISIIQRPPTCLQTIVLKHS